MSAHVCVILVCVSNRKRERTKKNPKKSRRVRPRRRSRQAAEGPAFLLTAQQQAAFGRDDRQVATTQCKSSGKK